MSRQFITLLIIVAVVAIVWYAQKQPSASPVGTATGCDASLWQHVYHPQRLKVLDACKVVTGTIESAKSEADGDEHIRLKLDPEFNNLLIQGNLDQQRGDLVLEPVCLNKVTQADAEEACNGFQSNIVIPPAGTHVRATGSYVNDLDHGWTEIHPVSSIELAP